ncbi:hypothetical protein [Pseudomonas asplenii]|uniref:hypothetical protein n=1 Tax=Pseudomonas asplenii TaxID=53407 RepID=UPI0023606860|nr:hypothetical protein [Pseudomonas asplenii]
MNDDPKFWPIDAPNAYPEPVGTLDKLELSGGAVWVHLNGKRSKLVGLQSLAFLIGNLQAIHGEVFSSAEPSAPKCSTCQDQGEVYSGKMADQGYNQPPEPVMDACPDCKWDAKVERDERKLFEKAVIDRAVRFHPNLEQCGDNPDAEYQHADIEWAWGLWQARAAMERKP